MVTPLSNIGSPQHWWLTSALVAYPSIVADFSLALVAHLSIGGLLQLSIGYSPQQW
jgi:hypothetical protein